MGQVDFAEFDAIGAARKNVWGAGERAGMR
jgi:hypothetical protein